MAKLFYTLEETAAKLGKDEAAITELVTQGKLREFRDHDDKLMFKVQDVDLLTEETMGGSAGSMELDLSENLTLGGDSDTFELDLDDADSEPKASSGRSASPVGLGSVSSKAGDDLPMELDLDLDEAPVAKSAAPAKKSADEGETFALDLDESAPGTAPAAASKGASASMSAMAAEPAAQDELTLELDLGEEPAAAPAAPRSAPTKAMDDSLGSMAAGSAAGGDLGLEGSNLGGNTPDGSSISDRIGVEGGSSGSGLMDLTNESESSSIGAALMDEAFSNDEQSELPANASGIFGGEGGGSESGAGLAAVGVGAAVGAAAAVATGGKSKTSAPIFTSGPAAPEAYSGSWSGLGVGMLLPASLALGAAMAAVAAKFMGAPADLAVMYAKDWMMYTGGLAGLIVVCGGIGFFVGKATE